MKHTKQYTIRGVSEALDRELRKLADQKGTSLNTWVLDVLLKHSGLQGEELLYHDLDALSGQWKDDAQMTKVLKAQRQIDKDLWK